MLTFSTFCQGEFYMTDRCSCDQQQCAQCTGPLCDFHVLPERCTGCALCVPLCAYDAIDMIDGKAVINTKCLSCGACFAGCPERAIVYCRREDSSFDELVVRVNREECIGCELCVSVCPAQAIEMPNGKAEISSKCIRCGTCLYNCPVKAIAMVRGTLPHG